MPPVESEADRASFFNPDEFGQLATIRGQDIAGYFNESSEFVDDLAPVSVQSTNPIFQCQSALLPANLEEGEPITVERQDGTTFEGEVVTVEADGFGITELQLRADV